MSWFKVPLWGSAISTMTRARSLEIPICLRSAVVLIRTTTRSTPRSNPIAPAARGDFARTTQMARPVRHLLLERGRSTIVPGLRRANARPGRDACPVGRDDRVHSFQAQPRREGLRGDWPPRGRDGHGPDRCWEALGRGGHGGRGPSACGVATTESPVGQHHRGGSAGEEKARPRSGRSGRPTTVAIGDSAVGMLGYGDPWTTIGPAGRGNAGANLIGGTGGAVKAVGYRVGRENLSFAR